MHILEERLDICILWKSGVSPIHPTQNDIFFWKIYYKWSLHVYKYQETTLFKFWSLIMKSDLTL
jgi:hypothetical protein